LSPPPKDSFQVPIFIFLEIFLRGGTKSIIVYRLALGMECRVLRSGTQQCDRPSERASCYVHSGAICALSKAISEAISGCAASGAPQITEFTVMGYPPLLLSDKISTSYLLPLLSLRLLMPQLRDTSVRLSFVLHSTSPARPLITSSSRRTAACGKDSRCGSSWRTVACERDLTLEQRRSARSPPPEEEGAAETVCDELNTTPIPRPPVPLGEGGSRETGMKLSPGRREEWREGDLRSSFISSLSYSDLIGDKLNFLFSLSC